MERDEDGVPGVGATVVAVEGRAVELSSIRVLEAHLEKLKAELLGHVPPQQLLLGELVDDWLRIITPERVEPENEQRLSKHLREFFLDDESSLTVAAVEDHLKALRGKLSNSTINKVRNVGKRSIERAISERRWSAPNPFKLAPRLKEDEIEFDELSLLDLEKLQRHLRPDRRREFRVMLHLGLRTGELFALKKLDVDFTRGCITIRRSHARDKTKTDKTRVVPILPAIAEDLAQAMVLSPTDLVFGKSADGALQRRDTKMARVIHTAMVKAGVGIASVVYKCRRCGSTEELPPPVDYNRCPTCAVKRWPVPKPVAFGWYDLRHMSATLHRRYGADPLTLALCMGWSIKPFGMQARYIHPSVDDKKRELSRWALPRFVEPQGSLALE